MKCAMPGMYGRKVPIESSTIRDDFIDQNVLKEANNNLNPEEIAKELEMSVEKVMEIQKSFKSIGTKFVKIEKSYISHTDAALVKLNSKSKSLKNIWNN